MRIVVAPKVEKREHPGRDNSTTETHPAYAQIGASRVSGRTVLYGSDFTHHHYMTIRIYDSQLNRDLNRDWAFAGKQYIEVAMSEAQWATFVSTPNDGMGVQCTLTHLRGVGEIPGLPEPTDRQAQFKAELAENASAALEAMAELGKKIEALGVSKKQKDELSSALYQATRELRDSMPFLAKSFDQHVEKTIERAKVEVNAYAQHTIMRTGLAAIAGGAAPIEMLPPVRE